MSSGKSFVTDKHLCGGSVLMLFITVMCVNTRYIKFSRMKQNEQYCSTPKGERVTGHSVPEPLSTAHRVSYVTGAVLLIHFHPVCTPDVMELAEKPHSTIDTAHTQPTS